jgi:general secretion pathway protein F
VLVDAGARLPWPTRMALAVSDVLAATWWVLPLVAGGLAALLWRLAGRGATARELGLVAALPVAGPLVGDAAVARATHALGMLLQAGIPLDAALPLAAEAAGPLLAAPLAAVGAEVRDGGTVTQALVRAGGFPPLVTRLVATGERTGALGASLLQAARLLEGEVARRIERLTAWLEPALVIVTGSLVLAVVTAILVPILQLDPTGGR